MRKVVTFEYTRVGICAMTRGRPLMAAHRGAIPGLCAGSE